METFQAVSCDLCYVKAFIYIFKWYQINIKKSIQRRTKRNTNDHVKRYREIEAHAIATVQTFNPCTSRPDVCKCLVLPTPMDNMSEISQAHQWPTKLANQSYVQLWGHQCIYAQETGWQSDVRSCIMPGLPTHLVQELYIGTVACQWS